jgi:hypothetical protein
LAAVTGLVGFLGGKYAKSQASGGGPGSGGGGSQAGHAAPAILLAILFASFLFILAVAPAIRAAPYLICDPYPTSGTQPTEFSLTVDGAATVTSSAQTLTDGSRRLHYDLAGIATGAHTVTYKAVLIDPYWGRLEGPASDPFDFTRPGVPAKGTGTALAP